MAASPNFAKSRATKFRPGDTLEAECYQTVLRLAAEHADEIDRRYPKVLRRVGGYNLNEFVDSRPVNLAKMHGGLRGHVWAWCSKPKSIWSRCRRPRP